MIRPLLIAFLALLLALPGPAAAQENGFASLLADRVEVRGNAAIVAEGNVEIHYQGTRLTAGRLVYDRDTGALTIDGPITLTDGPDRVLLADAAALDADLRNGILQAARLVLDRQLQLAAVEIARVDGRYTQLYKSVASSCEVCAARPVPLWRIRAEKVIHDGETRQLYFEGATFDVAGTPIVYFPRLRLPDPTVRRATGFLVPSIHTSTRTGTALKVPYFITLGDHADLTLAPFLSARTKTLQFRVRRAFARGMLEFDGAVSDDGLGPGRLRGYLFGRGEFDLGRGYDLRFDARLTSDTSYLYDYDFASADRLESRVEITRVARDERIAARLFHYRTLRQSELATSDRVPFVIGEALIERRFFPAAPIGGQGAWHLTADGYRRASEADGFGRDGLFLGAGAEWSREFVLRGGVLARLRTALDADLFLIQQDSAYRAEQAQIVPAIAAEFRWPLVRQDRFGGTELLEPVAQIAWSGPARAVLPNDYSTLTEFDGGNLLSLDRFPGADRSEEGLRGALGLTWSRLAPDGQWSATLGAARVFRAQPAPGFSAASGLDGLHSDWLLAGHLTLGEETALTSRNLLSPALDLTKSETRIAWAGEKLDLGATYTYVIADTAENRPRPTSELIFDTAYRVNRHWTAELEGRYDFQAGRPVSAGLGVVYRNECITVDLGVTQRFTSAGALAPATSASLQVSLAGFGSGGNTRAVRRQCMR